MKRKKKKTDKKERKRNSIKMKENSISNQKKIEYQIERRKLKIVRWVKGGPRTLSGPRAPHKLRPA